MATTPRRDMTDNQKQLAKSLDIAMESCIAYAAPEVPLLGNATKEGLTEELGRLNEARKAMEKTEKIVRGRLDALLDGERECRGDNFEYKIETTSRYALDQKKAKATLESQGVLDDHMVSSEVDRRTVKRI